MRQKADPQRYFDWSLASTSKVVLQYEEKYHRISAILDANPHFVELVHRDLKDLSSDKPENRRGRKADFTSENILRALIVHIAGRGARTMRSDSGLNARQRMARDIQDIRSNFGRKYNQGG